MAADFLLLPLLHRDKPHALFDKQAEEVERSFSILKKGDGDPKSPTTFLGLRYNGLELEMPNAAFMNAATLLPAIKSGAVTEAIIDDKVRRILRKAIEFGFFDRDQTDTSIPLYSQDGRRLVLEEARGGMVLLKSENHLLPLDRKKIKTIAVLGPNAYPAVVGGGGSSLTKPFNAVSFLGVSCLQKSTNPGP